jgi:hypothetical protein
MNKRVVLDWDTIEFVDWIIYSTRSRLELHVAIKGH